MELGWLSTQTYLSIYIYICMYIHIHTNICIYLYSRMQQRGVSHIDVFARGKATIEVDGMRMVVYSDVRTYINIRRYIY